MPNVLTLVLTVIKTVTQIVNIIVPTLDSNLNLYKA